MNSASIVDEGTDAVLNNVRQLGSVNASCLVAMSWAPGTGGRQQPGQPLPDHGVQAHDTEWDGGLDVRRDLRFHRQFTVEPPNSAVGYGDDWDLFAEVVPAARARYGCVRLDR